MSAVYAKISTHFSTHVHKYVLLFLLSVSLISSAYFYWNGKQLAYGDAVSRLNISRKITDNLTPGIAQVGNVWLPLPTIAMVPFVAQDFIWHSGIGGTIVSSFFFILGGYYLFKAAQVNTDSIGASIVALLVYSLNINLLYLQSTAMSEAIFLGLLPITTYYFCLWMKTNKMPYLLIAAISVSALTLVRYEALAILGVSILFVGGFSYLKTKSYSRTEGSLLLYGSLASLGFALWSLYLWAIFGDPLYWVHYYAAVPKSPVANAVASPRMGLFSAAWWYLTSVVWMNGIFIVVFAMLGVCLMLYTIIRSRQYYLLSILLQFSLFLFMILTLMRNTPIGQPLLTLQNILSPKTTHFAEFNIRYGMLMLPFLALAIAYLVKDKIYAKVFFSLFLAVQVYCYFNPFFTPIFQFNQNIPNNSTQGSERDKTMESWLHQNYDSGLILISAEKHDPQMFQLGLPYKTYIHEGAGKYWKESLQDPTKYSTWVVMDYDNTQDGVTKKLKNSSILDQKFDLVLNYQNMRVYKIKGKSNITVNK